MSQGGNDDKQAPKILTKTIGEKFNDGTEKIKSLYSCARIYKVPEDLRKLNECAYVPRLITIGPLHRKDELLQKPMQDVKMDYANRLFLRLTEGIADSKIRDEKKDELIKECGEKMKKCSVKAKKYYAEELELNDDEMVEMMLVDGCFILELLYVYYHTNYCQDSSSIPQPINGGKGGNKSNRRGCEQPRADPICDSILTANIIRHDLMLLENQIPFFVLEHLFELTVAKIPEDQTMGCPPKLSLEHYVRSYFLKFLSLEGEQSTGSQPKTSCFSASDHCILSVCDSTKETKQGKTESGKANDYYHILHLIHSSYIPGEEGEETELGIQLNSTKHCELTLSASDLHYAGVKFEPTRDLLEVKFINEGIGCWQCRTLAFRIPTIYIRKTTESFLRNVIALEQCFPRVPRYFTSYAKLMDMFINSEQDVRVLINDKVIHNYLSTNEDVRIVLNLGIGRRRDIGRGVSVSGRIGDTSRESGVAVVNFLTFLAYRPIRYGTYRYRSLQIPRRTGRYVPYRPIFKTMDVRDLFNKLCKEVVLEDFHFDKDCREASKFNMRWRTRAVRYVTRLLVSSPWPALAFFLGIATFAIAVYKFGSSINHARHHR